MPNLYLSPSLQEYNLSVIGGSEEYHMNRIADAMEPYLRSSGIRFTRNHPGQTLSQVIQQSNAGDYGLHFALHSNAAPAALSGRMRGADFYFYPESEQGARAARILAQNYTQIYPLPNLVKTMPTTSLAEIVRVRAPSVLAELGYHDNVADATWMRDNTGAIARNLVQGITLFFGIPFVRAQEPRQGVVNVPPDDTLNIRRRPDLAADVLTTLPDGAPVTVLGQWRLWYVVETGDIIGYADTRYIDIP